MGFHFTLTAEPEVDIRLNSEGSSPNETSPPKTPSDVGSRAHSMPIPLTGLYALLPDPEKARCRSRSNSLTSGLIKQSSSGLFSTGSEADVTATNKDLVSNEVLNATSDKGVDEAVEVFPSGIVSPVANSVLSSGIPQLIFAAETAIDRTEPKDYLVTSDQLRSFDVYDINIGPTIAFPHEDIHTAHAAYAMPNGSIVNEIHRDATPPRLDVSASDMGTGATAASPQARISVPAPYVPERHPYWIPPSNVYRNVPYMSRIIEPVSPGSLSASWVSDTHVYGPYAGRVFSFPYEQMLDRRFHYTGALYPWAGAVMAPPTFEASPVCSYPPYYMVQTGFTDHRWERHLPPEPMHFPTVQACTSVVERPPSPSLPSLPAPPMSTHQHRPKPYAKSRTAKSKSLKLLEARKTPSETCGTQELLEDVPIHNQFDIARVKRGEDGRTTVMIKNVPNKMHPDELVEILTSVKGVKFDFVYLRVDFDSKLNKSYAFVNFVTVGDLLAFANKKLGMRWGVHESDKVLQLSYAKVQGKTLLWKKFRNSVAMELCEAWRPRFYTSSGPDQGRLEEFPGPPTQGQCMCHPITASV